MFDLHIHILEHQSKFAFIKLNAKCLDFSFHCFLKSDFKIVY